MAIAWAATVVEVLVDAVWPGAQAGARLARKAIGGGIAFEFDRGRPAAVGGLAVGALVALAVAMALRHVRAGAVKAGGDLRGTAVIEDGAGIVGSSAGLVPFVGFVMAIGAGALVYGRAAASGEVQGPARASLMPRGVRASGPWPRR